MDFHDSIYWKAITHYCQYRDRNHKEVRNKLLMLGATGLDLENLIAALISEGFLDEERYAKSYVRGHFNNKQWGRQKIIAELKQQQVSSYCITNALQEIDDDVYYQVLRTLFERKKTALNIKKWNQNLRGKVYKYLIQKGYESQLILELIKKEK